MKQSHFLVGAILAFQMLFPAYGADDSLDNDFVSPPDTARPWVYWYFMDGHLTREGMTADLEAMKKAGIGGALYLEVGIGIPRGPVEFMSAAWRELLKHAVAEADRLGIQMAIGSGPGWCGTGGPWVKPEQSMQHLVASETAVTGPAKFDAVLPQPPPRKPYFGEKTLTPETKKAWQEFYKDVAVLAMPAPEGNYRLADINEKALYHRDPYSSKKGVKPFLPAPADYQALLPAQCIEAGKIIDLTTQLKPDGRLTWDVPPGRWLIMRLGRTVTGQITRPAPRPGLGFETDKFDKAAIDAHFDAFIETLLKTVGEPKTPGRGLTTLHFDSWEMSSQNWSGKFREEFTLRRGYDPLRYLPVMLGRVVGSMELSERFLWDLRQTAQELVCENHVSRLRELGRRHGLEFSVEPYDLNPTSDLTMGSIADVPMCEFWSKGYGYPTEFSCIEAASIAHTTGRAIVGAEAFTASPGEDWRQHPASMKAQGDWAFCSGINRIVFHRYQAQPWLDRFPGMTMGSYGVHWDRTQTWWDMVGAYHLYLSRCQQMLRRGLPVADILYLVPEGAPHVFRPPGSAVTGDLPDRLGYNFDGCSPDVLLRHASVRDGLIVFPHGMSYRVLVLPQFDTMTPQLLGKIKELVEAGATILGAPPRKSPSLVDYPRCDEQVKQLAAQLWKSGESAAEQVVGKGRVIFNADAMPVSPGRDIYASYPATVKVLSRSGVSPDFESDASIRYIHRREGTTDFYFIANRENRAISATCRFRVSSRRPEWWNPVTGERRDLPRYEQAGQIMSVPVQLAPLESGFMVFRKPVPPDHPQGENFPQPQSVLTVNAPWEVSFNPRWGGPEKIVFTTLDDWSKRDEPGIKYYSGKAVYRASFDLPSGAEPAKGRYFVSLGEVKNMASVKLNGKDLGVAWCDPWRVEAPAGVLKAGNNTIEITVANLWINRLVADSALPENKRLTWTTRNPFKQNSPLMPSGLLGPVTLLHNPD